MRNLIKILALFCFVAISAQIKIELPFNEIPLKNYPEKNYKNFYGEDLYIDNISNPEMYLYKAKGDYVTDKIMIICPGGGLFFSAYEKEGTALAKKLSANGITAAVLKYRLFPIEGYAQKWLDKHIANSIESVLDSAKIILPYSTLDALNAIENIRNNSKKYGVNPSKIGLMGFSAGGAVTMEAAYKSKTNNEPNFIAPIYAWMDIVENQKVPTNKPPAFISCANNDGFALAPASVEIYQDWISSGASAELHMFDQGGHGFGMQIQNEPVDNWSDLLIDWILSL